VLRAPASGTELLRHLTPTLPPASRTTRLLVATSVSEWSLAPKTPCALYLPVPFGSSDSPLTRPLYLPVPIVSSTGSYLLSLCPSYLPVPLRLQENAQRAEVAPGAFKDRNPLLRVAASASEWNRISAPSNAHAATGQSTHASAGGYERERVVPSGPSRR
jgi:hypothetical protein